VNLRRFFRYGTKFFALSRPRLRVKTVEQMLYHRNNSMPDPSRTAQNRVDSTDVIAMTAVTAGAMESPAKHL
jgi:hypothetical protein